MIKDSKRRSCNDQRVWSSFVMVEALKSNTRKPAVELLANF